MKNCKWISSKWVTAMCLVLMLMLVACGQGGNEVNVSGADSIESLQQKDATAADSGLETTGQEAPESFAAAVVVTINPQVKLYLDTDYVIISVEYLNEDAKTAFSDIDFFNITMEEGMEKIITAAVEKDFLTDGKGVNIEVAEVKDMTCDTAAICEQAETATVKAAEENHVTAVVTVQVSAELSEIEKTGNVADETAESTTEETNGEAEEPSLEESSSEEAEPETEPVQEQPTENAASDPCVNCGGTGKCDECKGDGYRGAGYAVSCPRCHGSLTETCIYCDANGNSIKHDGVCDFPNCMGAHVYPCTICGGGTKPVVCASCNGSGKCKVCGGTGTK